MSAAPAVYGDERLAGGEILSPSAGEASLDGAALHLGPHAARFLRLA
jgi:alpha-glucosidase